MKNEREIWFPAKRYGWGWGPPVKWQGWVVLAAFVAGIVYTGFRFPPSQHPLLFAAVVGASACALTAVCWWKGETPRWRWGDDD